MELVTWVALSIAVGGMAVGLLGSHLLTTRKKKLGELNLEPPQAMTGPSMSFTHYPGKPQGYAGYTDYAAMSCELNDSLIDLPPAEQFRSVGFGVGFVERLLERAQGKDGVIFYAVMASSDDARDLGWLAFMQEKGTDNAAPSTANLASALRSLASNMQENGPITIKYWDTRQNGNEASQDWIAAENATLFQIFEEGQNRGKKLADNAKAEDGR